MRRTKYNKGKKASVFITNLYKILEDSTNHIHINWCDDQESFIILNISRFSETVLPKYYKHSNYSSFVRQLNMYNFTKLRSQNERQHVFKNQMFVKNTEENLKNIKRREVISTKNSNILSMAHALNSQIQSESSQNDIQQKYSVNEFQNNAVEVAAPCRDFNFLIDSPILEGLRLTHSVSDYLFESEKINHSIPLVISLKCEQVSFPLKNMIKEMKISQDQLEQVCIGLYKQNEFLTVQNQKLQQKLKTQFRRKQQILDQIIKYVMSFLNERNGNLSQPEQEKQFHRQSAYQESDSSSDVILESYDLFQKRKFEKNKTNSHFKDKKPQKSFTFSKYAQNQRKILLTLVKQIQKSYNDKFFFTGSNVGATFYDQKGAEFSPNYSKKSTNSFLVSMLLKLIQSNNLTQVVKRFSLLINMQRNKKSKNFTVVNCMKDLTEHFKMKQFDSEDQFLYDFKMKQARQQEFSRDGNSRKRLKSQQMDYLISKERFLQNQKQTINKMQRQLALITSGRIQPEKTQSLQKINWENKLELIQKSRPQSQVQLGSTHLQSMSINKECLDQFQQGIENFLIEKFNFRLE